MLLAKHSVQQLAGLATMPAIVNRVVGKFKVEESYQPYGDKVDHYSSTRPTMLFPLRIPDLVYNGARPALVESVKLASGVTVAAVDVGSPVVSLGVYCGAGSRQETRGNLGCAHVLKNAWFGTTTRRTYIGGYREPAQCGVDIHVSVSREVFGVTAVCARDKSDLILDHMTQNLICPEMFDHELRIAKKLSLHQTQEAMSNPDVVLLEEAHKLAYRGKGLGNSLFLKPDNAGTITRESALDFVSQNMKDSNNLVVVGVGLDLDTVSALADDYLWSLEAGGVASPAAQWTGLQESHIETGGDLTKALFLAEGAPAGTPEALVLNLMRVIVGGSNISAVKHGDLHNKLMAASTAQQPHVTHCINVGYSDSGMFGLSVTANNEEIGDLLKSSLGVMRGLVNPISEEELGLAKSKLKHAIATERDNAAGLLESAALESLLSGSNNSLSQICTAIDNITAEKVASMAKKLANSQPVLVSLGNLDNMPLQRELS